jgi:hypothetical protein
MNLLQKVNRDDSANDVLAGPINSGKLIWKNNIDESNQLRSVTLSEIQLNLRNVFGLEKY